MTYVQPLPDTLTTQPISGSWATNGSTPATTLTIPRDGHYMIAIDARMTCNNTGFGGSVNVNVGGSAGVSDAASTPVGGTGNSGTMNLRYGFATHGTYTAGQTITITFTGTNSANNGSVSGNLYAHFVPIPGAIK